jgi:nucleoside-diphosphate-sugar epimerase
MANGMDGVFHLATLGHMNNYTVTEEMFKKVNIDGTLFVLEEARQSGVSRFVHCSSVAAMGICKEIPATENSPCLPHHPYGRSKLEAEHRVLNTVHSGLEVIVIRFSMVYGPGDVRDILKLTRLAKKGFFPRIGRRPKLTPLIHVQDAVNGLCLAMDRGKPGEIYLLTNPHSEPFDHLRKIILNALEISRPPLYIPEWLAMVSASLIEKLYLTIGRPPPVTRKNIESTLADRVFSIEKSHIELDFQPEIPVVEGLRETVKWYQKEGLI